jgi:putative endonuclease
VTTARQRLGNAGEDAACAHFERSGYRIVARNHRCRRGEVDLIAARGELLVFVEVRTRQSDAFGGPEETVNFAKRRKFILAAQDFLARWRGRERGVRFDVIAVVGPDLRITHYENAFDAAGV